MVVAQFHVYLSLFPSLSLCLFSHAHLLSLPRPICLYHLTISVSLHFALIPCLFLLCPKGDTFYILCAYSCWIFISWSSWKSLSLSVWSWFLAHGWDGCTRLRARGREQGKEGELPITFPLWVSVSLSPLSLHHSEVVLINSMGSLFTHITTTNPTSPQHTNK